MSKISFGFKPEFKPERLVWSKPDSPPPVICSYCSGALPEVPLTMWKDDGAAISFCDDCVKAHISLERPRR